MYEEYYTVKDIAKTLNLSITAIYKYIASGKLIAYKIGGTSSRHHWRIKASDFDNFLKSNKQEPDRHTESPN